MTLVGVAGLALGLLAWSFAFVRPTRSRIALFIIAYCAHVGAAVIYHQWVLTTTADAYIYYYDSYRFYQQPFGLGTRGVVHIVQWLKSTLGGSYLDYFLLFQAFGFWGIALLMRIMEELHDQLGIEQTRISYAVALLPSLHFWTAAIGKDGPMFLACTLALWAILQLRRRIPSFVMAVAIMVLFRPHIALLTVIALGIAAATSRAVGAVGKIALLGGAAVGIFLIAGTLESTLQVKINSAEAIGDFFQRQSEVTSSLAGNTAVVGASFPIRLISLLFRPFFVDAGGAFGLISSVENAFILLMVLTLLAHRRQAIMLVRHFFPLKFAVVFAGALILLLAQVYYNVGLGLRQKTMFMPALLTLFVAVHAVVRARKQRPVPSFAG